MDIWHLQLVYSTIYLFYLEQTIEEINSVLFLCEKKKRRSLQIHSIQIFQLTKTILVGTGSFSNGLFEIPFLTVRGFWLIHSVHPVIHCCFWSSGATVIYSGVVVYKPTHEEEVQRKSDGLTGISVQGWPLQFFCPLEQ